MYEIKNNVKSECDTESPFLQHLLYCREVIVECVSNILTLSIFVHFFMHKNMQRFI